MGTVKENIEQRLMEILKRKNAVCVVLDGEWGVGKTTFWKNFSAKNFDKILFMYLYSVRKASRKSNKR